MVEEALKKGIIPKLLAVDDLCKLMTASQEQRNSVEGNSLFDFLSGYTGTASGTSEALSENCSQRFAQRLVEKQQRGQE